MEHIKTVGAGLAFAGAISVVAVTMLFCLLGALMVAGIEYAEAWNAIVKTFTIFTVYLLVLLHPRKR